ncbi:MAG: penicillin-binding protein 2 [Candidatus Magnetominusculus sp. LBB02]|nr:penicillin-binding protein 2 [Candidatus Magnetominusculus sp. LBB02]
MNKRFIVVYGLIFVGFFVLIGRLFDIMVIKHDKFVKKSENQRMAEVDVQVRRGIIVDRLGRRLAVNLEDNSVYLDKTNYNESDKRLQEVSDVIGVSFNDLLAQVRGKKNFVWLKRKIPIEETEKLSQMRLSGIGLTAEPKRYYSLGSMAAHIIGFVNIDNKGLEGIESFYDKELVEHGGKYTVEKDARGNTFYNTNENERTGNTLMLTIDQGLQYIVEKELDDVMDKWHAAAATVIMMDPYTGEILALSNRPTFDPNSPGKYGPAARRNRAITDFYEPGSTFKIVMATGVLEENLTKPDEKIDCLGGSIEVGGKRIKDAHPHGVLTFMEVIQKSSNVGSIRLAMRLGKQRLYSYIKKFGFGDKTGIDLPGEVAGRLRNPERWSGVSIGCIPIGQEVAVTPLQMVTAYSMVANGGFRIAPSLVKEIVTADGAVHPMPKKYDGTERIISQKTIDILKNAFTMVTQEGGTATFAKVEGNLVAGKTGTAQIYDRAHGGYSHTDFISSFVGFVPADKPAFAMIVVVWKPRGAIYGGVVAGPVFKNIATKALTYLNVPKEEKLKNTTLVVANESIGHN